MKQTKLKNLKEMAELAGIRETIQPIKKDRKREMKINFPELKSIFEVKEQ